MILIQVFIKKIVEDYKKSGGDINKYDEISNWLMECILNKEITSDEIKEVFDLYSTSIFHIELFNIYFPCCYVPHNINLYTHLVIYTLFVEETKGIAITQNNATECSSLEVPEKTT